jgi:hypothetical protein
MKRLRPILLRLLGVLLLAYIGFVGVVWWSMHQPPETFGRVMSHMPVPAVFVIAPFETMWIHARAGDLRPGDAAPDFALMKLDKSERVQLSALTAKSPVVLVFGSYT